MHTGRPAVSQSVQRSRAAEPLVRRKTMAAVAAVAAAARRPFDSDTVKFDGSVKAFRTQRAMLGAKCGAPGGLVMIYDYQRIHHCGSSSVVTPGFGDSHDLQHKIVGIAGAHLRWPRMVPKFTDSTTTASQAHAWPAATLSGPSTDLVRRFPAPKAMSKPCLRPCLLSRHVSRSHGTTFQ